MEHVNLHLHPVVRRSDRSLRLPGLFLSLALMLVAPLALAADERASRYYEDALTRFEREDHAGAVIQLKNALQIDKGLLPVHVLLGKALLANGEMVAAEAALNEALRLGVSRAEVVLPLARAVLGQGRPADLLDETKFPTTGLSAVTLAELLVLKAGAHADLGKPREAMPLLERARQVQPNSAGPWLAEVPIRIRARQMAEARAAADRALLLAPDSAEALYIRGSVSHAGNDIATALDFYGRALAQDGDHLESLLARAGIRLDAGDLALAEADLESLKRSAPRDPRATYLRALAAERGGRAKEARDALAEVTGLLDPIPLETLRYRPQVLILGGLSHYGLRQFEKAKPYLETIQRDQPASPASKLLAQIHVADGNHDRAVEVLEAYLRNQPRDVQAQLLLANAHLVQRRHSRAIQVLQSALQVNDSAALRSALGIALLQSDRPNEALPQLEQAYRMAPSDLRTGVELGNLYLRARRPADAAKVAEALLKRQPENPTLQNLLGAVRDQQGKGKQARAAFEQALKLAPDHVPASLNLARLDAKEGRLDAAAQRLDGVLQREPRNAEVLMQRGLIAEQLGADAAATSFYARAFDHSAADDLKPGLMLVTHHLRANRVTAAAEAVRQLTLKAPDDLSVQMANARVALAAKDPAAARTYLGRASRAAEFDPQLQVQVALMQMQAGDAKAAQYSLSKALQSDPQHVVAQAMMVEAEIALGDLQPAEQRARALAASQPKLSQAQALLGDVAMARGQPDAAVKAYRTAHDLQPTTTSLLRLHRVLSGIDADGARQLAQQWLRRHPEDADVHAALADAHARSGQMAAARQGYERVLALRPDDADALNNYAHVLLHLKDPGALKVAERALALRPETPHVIGTAGWAAHHAGQTDRALQLLRDARLRDPANDETRFYLATVLATAGRKAEARQELESALRSGRPFASEAAAKRLLISLQ